MGGMRGVGFAALLGLTDFRKDAFATGIHAWLIQRKYPQAEIAFSCPRLRPIINNDKINPMDVHERQLLQVVSAYRIFMPYASITISTRECARVRDNLVQIAATKISAGVSTVWAATWKRWRIRETSSLRSPTADPWKRSIRRWRPMACSLLWRITSMCKDRCETMCKAEINRTRDAGRTDETQPDFSRIVAVTARGMCSRPFPEQIGRVCRVHPRALILRKRI